ncbi:PACE efflux transporter [Solirhodobacter olei]|uniref:PACE efflux transporter n=1 Tax=Solirhodobacter olei TaxID=2493082 RepID=UPI000FD98E84|nr:PACE efflux transporter [Solirhodobacter olei]
MPPFLRRCLYVATFEGIGLVLVSSGLATVFASSLPRAGSFALASTLIATGWSFVFTTLFELWEARQTRRTRTLARRIAYAVGLEAGMLTILTPLLSVWLALPVLTAFAAQLTMTLGFTLYAFVFNWGFDAVFGPPRSARERA